MSQKRRSYSREFKQEAVKLVLESGISVAQAARDLGVPESALWCWKKDYEQDPRGGFPW